MKAMFLKYKVSILVVGMILIGLSVLVPQVSATGLTPAQAAGLNLGSDANYVFIDLGATNLGWNTGPLDGSVLFGQGLNAQLSGGNNGGLVAGSTLYYDSTTTLSGSLQNQPPESMVSTSVTSNALSLAQSVANYAKGLTPTQTFTNINNTTTITGNGGLNVINVTNIQNAKLTLAGTSTDFFVINISGAMNTNEAMTLNGVLASHVIFNFTGTSGNVFQTSGGDVLYGTFLSTYGGQYQFSNLDLTGELINTDGNVQLVSGSTIPTDVPFTPGTPEPNTLLMMGTGLIGVVSIMRKRIS